jgi:hypothetical protein
LPLIYIAIGIDGTGGCAREAPSDNLTLS